MPAEIKFKSKVFNIQLSPLLHFKSLLPLSEKISVGTIDAKRRKCLRDLALQIQK